jgi:hypothetical protein
VCFAYNQKQNIWILAIITGIASNEVSIDFPELSKPNVEIIFLPDLYFSFKASFIYFTKCVPCGMTVILFLKCRNPVPITLQTHGS